MDHEPLENAAVIEFFRSYLKQVVRVHYAMFEKLLFAEKGVPLELAELFEDAGNTYLNISEQISDAHMQRFMPQRLNSNLKPAS
jgi:hypothetical protein